MTIRHAAGQSVGTWYAPPRCNVRARPGWRVEETSSGWMLYPPDRAQSGVLVHKSPGSRKRWYENTVALLRQRGAPL
jgi:hypothetical protein